MAEETFVYTIPVQVRSTKRLDRGDEGQHLCAAIEEAVTDRMEEDGFERVEVIALSPRGGMLRTMNMEPGTAPVPLDTE